MSNLTLLPSSNQFPTRSKHPVVARLGSRIRLVVPTALCIALFLAIPRPIDGSSTGNDEPAIRQVLEDQVAAWNRGDIDGFMDGYWRDKKLSFTSGDTVTRGWDATRERYLKLYKSDGKEMGKLSFSELEIEGLSPTVMLVRGRYQLVLQKETATGRFTLIVRKFGNGWKITSDHTSAAEKPAQKK